MDHSPAEVPASLIKKKDVSQRYNGFPPNFGQDFLPHIFTSVGRWGSIARAYMNPDEAVRHSFVNAEMMRNEPTITECLEARYRASCLLNWSIVPVQFEELDAEEKEQIEDKMQRRIPGKTPWGAKELAAKVQRIISLTPAFTKYQWCLMEALWYGRYAVYRKMGRKRIAGEFRTVVEGWQPRHGDKLMFRFDDGSFAYDPNQIGIRIGWDAKVARDDFRDYMGFQRQRVEPTQYGLCYWLDQNQRRFLDVHKHIIEDGPFEDPYKAGSVHGVGIRSKIYWTWYAYQECMKLMLEYIERSTLGIEIWKYPAHNPQAEAKAKEAAQNRGSSGRSIILVPIMQGDHADMYGVDLKETSLAGLEELMHVMTEFYGHKMKRFIMGQTSTSETSAGGIGSGIADAHLATWRDVVRFDSDNKDDTLTHDLVPNIQRWNWPGSDYEVLLRFKTDTESQNALEKLNQYQVAWSMGLKLKAQDLYRAIEATRPQGDDEALANPAIYPPGMDEMMGGGGDQMVPGDEPMVIGQTHAPPGGVVLHGNYFHGGEFIPLEYRDGG